MVSRSPYARPRYKPKLWELGYEPFFMIPGLSEVEYTGGCHIKGAPSTRICFSSWQSITPGFRNAVADRRAFGVPTIRSDIPPYARRSVADTQNYGDDSSAR